MHFTAAGHTSPIILKGVLGALCLTLSAGCSTLNNMAENFEKRWDDPKAVLDEMEQNEPEVIDEQMREAEIAAAFDMVAKDNCEAAEDVAVKYMMQNPLDTDARLIVAECSFARGDFASARTTLEGLLSETGDIRASRTLGLVLAAEGDYEEAKPFLEAAVAEQPDDWRAWNGLGFIEDQAKNWESAEAAYHMAVQAEPKAAAPLNNLGMSMLVQGRLDDARDAFTQALSIDSELEAARMNLRIAHAMAGDYQIALAGASEQERAVVLNNAGIAAMSRGDLAMARKLFRQALAESPVFYAMAYENLERATVTDN